ncbi:OsmC family peroxiredoxin [Aquipuribacter nitratireducens]|uniref:OsmC family peroxiredoxin n=1 Tax=Aquipuribacter nitratireducens TaxID=650104 RepID=A0ABW0GPR4_9MICO
MTSRDATTRWSGDLKTGSGQTSLDSSNLGPFTVSWPARAEEPDGLTSPEELIAAAHSACLAMNLTGVLTKEGLTAEHVEVSAEVTLEQDPEGGFRISRSAVTLRAKVPDVDADRFAELARTAERTCPVSKALAGTTITLDAALED